MNPYEFMLPRLNGKELEADLSRYIKLVRKGIAGFILFGGSLPAVREGIKELQRHATLPLIIASDLERGLGQQLEGGTLFPWAMAMGSALRNGIDLKILKRAFSAIALEARYAGINTIFAPVLDINSNPDNPIIATRAFGEDFHIVSNLGSLMVKEFQKQGLVACGKHFPGHGDTAVDSHLSLAVINKDLKILNSFELKPFKAAIRAGVKAIMPGHLIVPSLDPSGRPATLSKKMISFLRKQLGFKGLVITDAMNMTGLSMPENEAAVLALRAGVNILLHPSEPGKMASYLSKKKITSSQNLLRKTRKEFLRIKEAQVPDFETHQELAREIALKAVRTEGEVGRLRDKTVVILADEPERIHVFISFLKDKGKELLINPQGQLPGATLAVVHSTPRGWHPPSAELKANIEKLSQKKPVWLSFGNPYIIYSEKNKILTYSDSEDIQREMAANIIR